MDGVGSFFCPTTQRKKKKKHYPEKQGGCAAGIHTHCRGGRACEWGGRRRSTGRRLQIVCLALERVFVLTKRHVVCGGWSGQEGMWWGVLRHNGRSL